MHAQQQKRILITGGAGFIGSHTANALLKQGHSVVVVDELNDYYDVTIKQENLRILQESAKECQQLFKFYKLDICDRDELEQVLLSEQITDVIHLAARAGVRASIQQPDLYVQSNVLGSTVIFDLVTKHRTQIKSCVYASSSSVYGMNEKVPFSETDPINRIVSPYAGTKKATEAMAEAYAMMYKYHITGLRFFTVYGPRGRPDMAPFKFVDRVMRGERIDQFGDGSSSRDYTYIDDIVSGIIKSMQRPETAVEGRQYHEVYNLGNSSPVTLSEFIQMIETVTGKRANKRIMPQQKGDVDRTFADVSKASRDFGYAPETSLEAGLTKLTEWWRSKYEVKSAADLGYHSNSDGDVSCDVSTDNS